MSGWCSVKSMNCVLAGIAWHYREDGQLICVPENICQAVREIKHSPDWYAGAREQYTKCWEAVFNLLRSVNANAELTILMHERVEGSKIEEDKNGR